MQAISQGAYAAEASRSNALTASIDDSSRIAHARNKQLAGEFLSFKLGAEEYGIDILTVQEIRSYEQPTRIANSPEFLKGVVNLRGVIVPLLDLRLKVGLDNVEYRGSTVVIVLNVSQRTVGVVVDSVSDVVQLQSQQIREVPEFNGAVDTESIAGIGDLPNRMMILLDIEKMLHAPEMGLFGRSTN